MKPIELLKSQNAVIAVLVIALFAQMPHAQEVFYRYSRTHDWYTWFFAWCAAVALEVAVLVFVVRGSIFASWGFALFSIAINLVYYYHVDATWGELVPTVLLSAGLPIAIALYSHEVAEPVHDARIVNDDARIVNDSFTNHAPVASHAMIEDATVQDVATVDPMERARQLKSEGLSNAAIAKELGVDPSTVSRWFKKVEA